MIILLIILVNLLVYYRTLSYAGICDDIPISQLPKEMPKNWWLKFWWHLHGYKYTSWKLAHWQTLGIHTINCVLIYIVFGMNYTSMIAAFLFSVAPVNNQCSIWLSGKCYSMNATYSLLMFLFPLASLPIYLFATYFCGASIILFPLVFLFTKYWYLSLLVGIGFLREAQRIFSKAPNAKFNTESNAELKAIKPRKIIIYFKSLGYHLVNSILGLRIGFYHKYLFLHGVSAETNKESYKIDKYFFVGIGIVAYTLYTRNIGLLWWWLTLSQWCNIISFNQTLANRYVYLPNVGLFYFLATVLVNYPILAVAIFAYYLTKLINFIPFYKNEYWSIEYSCWEQPDFFYPWQNRAVHCFMHGNFHGALGNMIKANELRPNDWKITYNLCQIYMVLGNINAAKSTFELAKKCTIDGRADAINHLMGKLEKWIQSIEEQAKTNNNQVSVDLAHIDMQR